MMIKFQPSFKNVDSKAGYEELVLSEVEVLQRVVSGEAKYDDSLGWIDTNKWASEEFLRNFNEIADEIKENADVFVLIGVGGSNNAARSVIEALKSESQGPEIIYSGNTLSPHQFNEVLKKLDGKSVYINCIAKNFETLEPGSSFRVLRQYLINRYGDDSAKRIIATGSTGSTLEQLCNDKGYRFLEFPGDVGGRYTAMTSVGLLPMAVAGIDINKLVAGAHEMQQKLHVDISENNLAYQYACYRNQNYRDGYQIEMLASFEPQFRWFNKWWLQLFAESEGKDNKGIYPTFAEYSEDLHAVGQYVQDGLPIMFETFLNVLEPNASLVIQSDEAKDYFDYLDGKDFWDINKAAYEATVAAHSEKLPCSVIDIEKIDAFHFGQLFYLFQFACYLSCSIMGVNPFDQPGVEAYKERMFAILKK
ncbi:MAG: glucose-6-phosphate isomerase [Oscillospiraceae bacterium]